MSSNKISYKSSAIFGNNLQFGKHNINCAIGSLVVNNNLTESGKLSPKNLDQINKTDIWKYIYYLRLHNKNNAIFKKYLGKGNTVTALSMYNMIIEVLGKTKKTAINTVSKKDLLSFFRKLFAETNITVPFMKHIEKIVPMINSYANSNSVSNSKVQSINNAISANSIKIRPIIELITNSNALPNSVSNNSSQQVRNTNSNSNNVRNSLNNAIKNINSQLGNSRMSSENSQPVNSNYNQNSSYKQNVNTKKINTNKLFNNVSKNNSNIKVSIGLL